MPDAGAHGRLQPGVPVPPRWARQMRPLSQALGSEAAGARRGSREDQSVWEDVRHPRAGLPTSSTGREWTGPGLLAAGPPHTSRGAAFCLTPQSRAAGHEKPWGAPTQLIRTSPSRGQFRTASGHPHWGVEGTCSQAGTSGGMKRARPQGPLGVRWGTATLDPAVLVCRLPVSASEESGLDQKPGGPQSPYPLLAP